VGRLVDRFGRARVLAPLAFAQASMYVTLVLASVTGAGSAPLIVVAALAGALLPPIAPVVRTLLREIFAELGVRETAYALEAVLQELLWMTGPLVVALVIAVSSPRAAVLVLAAVCMTGTMLFVRTPLVRQSLLPTVSPQRRGALASPELRALLAPVALSGAGLGAIEVGLPSLALHAGSRPASGVLLALWSVGSMIGGLWYGSLAWSTSLLGRYRMLLAAAVLCTAPLIAARSIAEGVACSLLAGLTISPVFSCQYALVGHAVAPGSETEAFTWSTAALIGGVAAGSAIGGALVRPAGVSGPFGLSCAATLLAAALAMGFRVRTRRTA
jgi:MFS family permease